MSLSWEPVLNGASYCAPACGGRCTKAAYDKAVMAACKLADRMGEGWTTRIWENLGWHYQVHSACGRIKLHKEGKHYTAYLGTADLPGGRWCATAAKPKAAVEAVLTKARAEIAAAQALVVGL